MELSLEQKQQNCTKRNSAEKVSKKVKLCDKMCRHWFEIALNRILRRSVNVTWETVQAKCINNLINLLGPCVKKYYRASRIRLNDIYCLLGTINAFRADGYRIWWGEGVYLGSRGYNYKAFYISNVHCYSVHEVYDSNYHTSLLTIDLFQSNDIVESTTTKAHRVSDWYKIGVQASKAKYERGIELK